MTQFFEEKGFTSEELKPLLPKGGLDLNQVAEFIISGQNPLNFTQKIREFRNQLIDAGDPRVQGERLDDPTDAGADIISQQQGFSLGANNTGGELRTNLTGSELNEKLILDQQAAQSAEDTRLRSQVRRSSGESVTDFTRRIDESSLNIPSAEQLRAINPNVTDEQIKQIQETSRTNQLRLQRTGQTGGSVNNPLSGEFSGGSTPRQQGTSNTPIVGTSFGERFKDLQNQLGLERPEPIDIFTRADELRLNEARSERDKIDLELTNIMNERLRLDEEFRKFSDEQVGLPEAGRLGAISEEGRAIERQLAALNRRELVLESKLRNRNNVISELSGLQQQEYADAVTDYNQRFSQALQLYSIFDKEQDELKQNASANLQVLSNTYAAQIDAGQITNLTGVQRARLQELEAQAGLPIGSTEAVLATLKPGETELYKTFNKETGQLQVFTQDANGNISVKVSQGTPSGTSPTDNSVPSSTTKTTTELATLIDAAIAQNLGAEEIFQEIEVDENLTDADKALAQRILDTRFPEESGSTSDFLREGFRDTVDSAGAFFSRLFNF